MTPIYSQDIAKFYSRPIIDDYASRVSNKPVYNTRVFVRIQNPGDNLSVMDRLATDQDKRQFHNAWIRFENLAQVETIGTPLEVLYASNPEFVMQLKEQGVHSVEALAALSAETKQDLPDADKYVAHAKNYLSAVNKGAAHEAMKGELASKDKLIADLYAKIGQLDSALVQKDQRIDFLERSAGLDKSMKATEKILANAPNR